MYICPVCKMDMKLYDNTYKCSRGHCFDVARKGYVNLLTTKGRDPSKAGDNADMVRARTEFLDKGYYAPLADEIKRIAGGAVSGSDHPVIIDSGCGEGFYTLRLADIGNARIFGIDISKHAVAHCMTRVHLAGIKNCSFAVASSFELPFGDGSADAVVSVFAPVCNDEYARVLKDGGALIVVSPSAGHLFELKAAVYDKPYLNRPNSYGLNRFRLEDETELGYKVHIPDNDDIMSLFMMTPYSYKTPQEGIERLRALSELEVTCAFTVQVYGKK